MHPSQTYELRVRFSGDDKAALQTKDRLIDWLLVNGVESFVEGDLSVEVIDTQDQPGRDFFSEFGGDLMPVSIYRYSKESLDDLQVRVNAEFGARIESELHVMQTETWMEGWKESFRPFATSAFHVCPPWIDEPTPSGLIRLVIEPGMAFGTGQHATTRLCLDHLGDIALPRRTEIRNERVLDVGTGTGILAIGAKLLGYASCFGTDIEDDAILASVDNAKRNNVQCDFRKGSMPDAGEQYNLVFANILAVVLLRIMDDLFRVTKPGGQAVLSGLLTTEEDEVIARAKQSGFLFQTKSAQSDWSAVVLRRPR